MNPTIDIPPALPAWPGQTQKLAHCYGQVVPGSAAENALIEKHLPLVKTIVGRLALTLPSHLNIEDLYSPGLVGLLNALRNFDPQGGSSFESYARVRIRGAIFDELRRLDWVPRSVHSKARRVQQAIQKLEQEHGDIPGNLEVAKEMGLSLAEYEDLLEEIKPATFICLDSTQNVEGDEDHSRYESVADDSQPNPVDLAVRRELAQVVAERLEQLPDMQRKVIALYYFEDLRLREIAEVFGVTESRICQIHSQAILAIKTYLKKHEASAC